MRTKKNYNKIWSNYGCSLCRAMRHSLHVYIFSIMESYEAVLCSFNITFIKHYVTSSHFTTLCMKYRMYVYCLQKYMVYSMTALILSRSSGFYKNQNSGLKADLSYSYELIRYDAWDNSICRLVVCKKAFFFFLDWSDASTLSTIFEHLARPSAQMLFHWRVMTPNHSINKPI